MQSQNVLELIEYLRENLKISVDTVSIESDYGKPNHHAVKVGIYLGKELITESESDSF